MPETTAVIIPIFKTDYPNARSAPSPIKASSPAEAHRQAAVMATFDTVERVVVREETVYTPEDISDHIQDTGQDAAGHRPRAFMYAKK